MYSDNVFELRGLSYQEQRKKERQTDENLRRVLAEHDGKMSGIDVLPELSAALDEPANGVINALRRTCGQGRGDIRFVLAASTDPQQIGISVPEVRLVVRTEA